MNHEKEITRYGLFFTAPGAGQPVPACGTLRTVVAKGAKVSKRDHTVNEAGRPTAYTPDFCALVTDYCMLGATLRELADLLEVSPTTIENWRAKHPEFRQAIAEGQTLADARVARSLYQRAIGYSCQDSHVCVIDGTVVVTPIVKNYPPDTAAAFIWLQNRRRGDWRQRRDDGEGLTPEDIAREAQEVISRAMATSTPP